MYIRKHECVRILKFHHQTGKLKYLLKIPPLLAATPPLSNFMVHVAGILRSSSEWRRQPGTDATRTPHHRPFKWGETRYPAMSESTSLVLSAFSLYWVTPFFPKRKGITFLSWFRESGNYGQERSLWGDLQSLVTQFSDLLSNRPKKFKGTGPCGFDSCLEACVNRRIHQRIWNT